MKNSIRIGGISGLTGALSSVLRLLNEIAF